MPVDAAGLLEAAHEIGDRERQRVADEHLAAMAAAGEAFLRSLDYGEGDDIARRAAALAAWHGWHLGFAAARDGRAGASVPAPAWLLRIAKGAAG